MRKTDATDILENSTRKIGSFGKRTMTLFRGGVDTVAEMGERASARQGRLNRSDALNIKNAIGAFAGIVGVIVAASATSTASLDAAASRPAGVSTTIGKTAPTYTPGQ